MKWIMFIHLSSPATVKRICLFKAGQQVSGTDSELPNTRAILCFNYQVLVQHQPVFWYCYFIISLCSCCTKLILAISLWWMCLRLFSFIRTIHQLLLLCNLNLWCCFKVKKKSITFYYPRYFNHFSRSIKQNKTKKSSSHNILKHIHGLYSKRYATEKFQSL